MTTKRHWEQVRRWPGGGGGPWLLSYEYLFVVHVHSHRHRLVGDTYVALVQGSGSKSGTRKCVVYGTSYFKKHDACPRVFNVNIARNVMRS